MNKIYSIAAAAMTLATSLFVASCVTDEGLGGEGEGKLKLTVSLQSDVVVTRAADSEASKSCKIEIYSSKGLVRQYKSQEAVPADGIVLLSGDYRVDVTAGDSVPAAFDKKYYKGSTPFTITQGTTTAEVKCKIANAVVSATFDESIKTMLSDYSLTVSNAGGSLTFTEDNINQKGYFMMDSAEDSLTYVLSGKRSDGSEYSYKGSVKQPKGGYEYAMTVKYGSDDLPEIGGAFIRVEVDETEIVVNDNHTLTMPPAFLAEDFVFADGLLNSPGDFKDMTLYVSCLKELKSCTVSGSMLSALGLSGSSYELMNNSSVTAFGAQNIDVKYKTKEENGEVKSAVLAIDIPAAQLNKMAEGEYQLVFTATDGYGKTSTGTLNVTCTNAYVITQDAAVSNINTYSATVTALIADATKSGYGIKYRKKGDANWTTATSSVNGTTITASLSNLEANTTYEYAGVTDGGYTAASKTFTTLQALQLQNGDMESWYSGSDKALCIGTSASDLFWDSGNHGSITMSKNVTTNSSDVKHGGSYSAKLQSQFVGLGIIGKFAAGNLFIGKYLKTDGTDGELGFGRAFKARPYALKVYVKYTPAAVDYTNSGAPDCKKGENDKGIIYVAMLDGTTKSYGDSSWPCIIKTKTKELFSKTDANVLGYGEKSWTSATEGDGMVEVTIPIDYYNMNEVPSNIIVCCSASAYGDYFAGGSGSVMYVDDFELLYK